MEETLAKRCIPCEGGIESLTQERIQNLLQEIPGWQLDTLQKSIFRHFSFKNFYEVMAFVNAIAWLANSENHHPNISLSYNECMISYTTHSISGLTENDFICAAKINALQKIV
ncbi:MAG: Putative pterin-4-alpha-carbinolamine dehydratase [Legionellaceae bacterium]